MTPADPVTPADLSKLGFRELAEALPGPSGLAPHEWLWLVGALATRAIREAETLAGDDWPAASRAILLALGKAESAGGIDRPEYVVRRLNLTAALLDRVGADPGVPIRDPRAALALLFDNLPVSPAEAGRLAPRWRELPAPEILRLRIAKNLLTPGRAIGAHAPDPRVDAWSEVYPSLP